MSGSECLARLRADASALSPRAAHIALALLPALSHLPDAWEAGLRATLTRRAGNTPPLSALEFDVIRVTAASLPNAYPEWVVNDSEHPAARQLIWEAWVAAERCRLRRPSRDTH